MFSHYTSKALEKKHSFRLLKEIQIGHFFRYNGFTCQRDCLGFFTYWHKKTEYTTEIFDHMNKYVLPLEKQSKITEIEIEPEI